MKITRRSLIFTAGSIAALTAIGIRNTKKIFQKKKFQGKISGANFARGHLIKKNDFKGDAITQKVSTIIVGGGVSGLSAAYHLKKMGVTDFLLLELDEHIGGNSSSGKNIAGKYPLGAHYLPIPSIELVELIEFLKENGAINRIIDGIPEYNDYFLCSAPHDRLYLNGRWQKGLIPQMGISLESKAQIKKFFKLMSSFKGLKGSDGKKAFSIPLSESSIDKKFTIYDTYTMEEFLKKNDFNDSYLRWYVNYCCLDDYGAGINKVSAWAGIHYFASRTGQGFDIDSSSVLTWPEGNYWAVDKLARAIDKYIKLNTLVYRIEENIDKTYSVWSYDFVTSQKICYVSKNIIYSSPRFTAKFIFNIEEILKKVEENFIDYAPWMTANLLLEAPLASGRGGPLAWDNVNFYGKSLGYVVSNHQDLSTQRLKTNITIYWPLLKTTTKQARLDALAKTHQDWCEEILRELEIIHPEISEMILSIDISLFGHAMSIPEVGFLNKSNKLRNIDGIYFAHTDSSGISIFEEAFYQGLNAAKFIENRLNS